jgi:transglutaminase-like putative cysteine protease
MFHAWNEVFSEGHWQGVDPTWNQVRLDATHIKLSDDLSAALLLASSTNEISFTVLDQSYF